VFAIPGFLVLSVFDSAAFQVAVIVATLLLAHLTVLAVFEPFAVIYVMVTYHKSIAGLTPDPVWDQRLQQVSDKFRELIGKARETASPDAPPTRWTPHRPRSGRAMCRRPEQLPHPQPRHPRSRASVGETRSGPAVEGGSAVGLVACSARPLSS
jgi:hypothetical protein